VGNLWVPVLYNFRIMGERLVSESFIVRVYRADTEDSKKINGLVESLDNSVARYAFANIDELAVILNSLTGGKQKKAKQKSRMN
jgi:hypothetical protein